MSEVKRYHVTEAGLVEGQALGRINVVLGPDYDSAVQCFLTAAEGCVAAERRERALQQRLTAADERADSFDRLYTSSLDERDQLQQRADVLEGLLRRVVASSVLSFEQDAPEELESLEADICAALKPAEGGGDEQG